MRQRVSIMRMTEVDGWPTISEPHLSSFATELLQQDATRARDHIAETIGAFVVAGNVPAVRRWVSVANQLAPRRMVSRD